MLIVYHLPKKNPTEKSTNLDIKKRWTNVKGKFPPMIRKTFLPDAKKYRDMNTKINYEAQKEHETLKREHLSRMKDEIEFQDCSFNPDLNMTSLKKAKDLDRVPIEGRGCPDRYNRTFIESQKTLRMQTLEQEELATLKIPDYGDKTPDPNFYSEKVKWKEDALNKSRAKADEQFQRECATFIGKPQVLDYSKNKVVNPENLDNGEFLQRVDTDIVQRKDRLKTLDQKYYNYPYKPTLYKPEKKTLD